MFKDIVANVLLIALLAAPAILAGIVVSLSMGR